MHVTARSSGVRLGANVATWLRQRIDPSRIYDHRILHELTPLGIGYDERAHQLWMVTGEIVNVPAYTPAQLLNHPYVEITNVFDPGPDALSITGFEMSAALHELLWPFETPPGNIAFGWEQMFETNVNSIAAREDAGYRQAPPGGWWRMAQAMTARRRS